MESPVNNGVKCTSCGHENIAGTDRCVQCFHSLMQVDLPRANKNDTIQRAFVAAPVSELLTGKDLLVANEGDSVSKVIKILQKEGRKCVLVYKKKKLVGILSNRDLLRKAAHKDEDLSKMRVGQVMTPNPEYVKASDPIAFAVNKMALGGFRHLPVLTEDGSPISIISIKDVWAYLIRTEKFD